jgi:CoA:oxalate CoA-transferase
MSYTGFPGNPPTRAAVPYVDFSTAILGAFGATLAILHKERTGKGQLVDVALLDTAFTFVAGMGVAAEYALLDHIRQQIGNHSFYNFTDSFQAKDGWIMISVIGNQIWRRFLSVIERQDLLEDERFADDDLRFRNRDLIRPIVADWISNRTVAEAVKRLEAKRVPCGPVNSVRDAVNDPHLIAREMLVKMQYPDVGEVPVPGIPIKLSETPGKIETKAPRLGEHNSEIYSRLLGYSQSELDSLKQDGII